MQGKAPLIIMDQIASIGDIKIESLDIPKVRNAFEDWINMS